MRDFDKKKVSASDIKKYLDSRDDFAFELRTFHACTERGFSSSHGGTYRDPVTDKPRQYDVRATIERGNRQVQLAVECKCLMPFYPLVVSCMPRVPNESYHEVVVSEPLQPGKPGLPSNAKSVRLEGGKSIYHVGHAVGKDTVQVGRSPKGEFIEGDRDVFEKWSQAVSSAQDLIAYLNGYLQQTEPCRYTVTVPVLVVPNETLWTVNYSAKGAQLSDPVEVAECVFYLGKDVGSAFPLFKYTISHLHIQTERGFVALLDRLAANERYWDELIPVDTIQKLSPSGAAT